MGDALKGRSVIVIGAGLAGLTAARALEGDGARVTVVEARDRAGGRIQTVRGVFADGQHAEAGADLIEGEQTLVLELARAVGLTPRRILTAGFTYYGPDAAGRMRVWRTPRIWEDVMKRLKSEIESYTAADQRWDSGVALALGRQSVGEWLNRQRAAPWFVEGVRSMRGFFVADPEDLSLLPLVDQFAGAGPPGEGTIFRIPGGNDCLPVAIAQRLRDVRLNAFVRRIRYQESRVSVTVEVRSRRAELQADYAVVAVPTTTLRQMAFAPALPETQWRAISTLRYGAATRVLLQFDRPFWRKAHRHRAFGTCLPIGAVWDASEHQRGRSGILMLLAGGRASAECRRILTDEGATGVVARLQWMGRVAPLTHLWHTSWEDDPLAGGAYAFFSHDFDPAMRDWLARPFGRILFAGEHTSIRSQGYMNGAVESGQRAAAEIRMLERYGVPRPT